MKKQYAILFSALCLLLCLAPSAGLLFGGREESAENRTLAKAPSLRTEDGAFNANILGDAGAYFEDHFAFRNEWVTGYALLADRLFQVSAQDSVIAGRNHWLYYKDSLKDYQGSSQLTDRQLFDIAHTLRMMQDGLREQAVEFVFAVAPNKNSLYGENMPYYYQGYREPENNASRLAPWLESEEVNVADLHEALTGSEAAKEITLYHERDSHWNNVGAAIAAGAIFDALDFEHRDYTDMSYESREDFSGDLDVMLFPAAVTPETEYYYEEMPSYTYVEEVESNFAPEIFTESDAEEGSLLMYRDSFGNALLPFMAENFSQSYFSRGVPYQLTDDVYDNDVDTVVVERAERFLPDMVKNPPMMLAPIVSASSLGEMDYTEEIENLAVTEMEEYTLVTGTVPEDGLETDARIFIRTGGLNYEAFPCSDAEGRESFSLLVVTELLDEEPVFELAVGQGAGEEEGETGEG